ncbi:30S ribosomal protein S20 [Dethiothermospora halolimnae]|uniref:30S ribosomal protein S20 n=1 Tax=Dethiothermospora halolimnae TaxID=3114390 RepID=UPI003CCB7FA6
MNLLANIKSAKKRIKVIEKKNAINRKRKSEIKTYINKFDSAIENNDLDTAKELLRLIEKKMDRAAAKGTLKKNAVSRKISRLSKTLNKAN